MKAHLEPWQKWNPTWTYEKPWKTYLELWKNHKNPPWTMKNQLGTMKNQPRTMKNHEKNNLEPLKTMKTNLDQLKTMKINLEPWKNHENWLRTMKNQPETMKNHENWPGTLKNHENRPGTMKNQSGRNKQKRYKQTIYVTDPGSQLTWEGGRAGISKSFTNRQFTSLTRGHNWPFRCLDLIWNCDIPLYHLIFFTDTVEQICANLWWEKWILQYIFWYIWYEIVIYVCII